MLTEIIIDDIQQKFSPTNQEYRSVKDGDGNSYACWFKDLFPHLESAASSGKRIKVEVKQSGKWLHIIGIPGVKIEHIPEQPQQRRDRAESAGGTPRNGGWAPSQGGGKRNFGDKDDERARGQARGLCFGKACDFAIAMYQKNPKMKRKDIAKKVQETFDDLLDILEKNDPVLRKRG